MDAGVALGAPWGEVQFLERNNDRVPIHGGAGTMGFMGDPENDIAPVAVLVRFWLLLCGSSI